MNEGLPKEHLGDFGESRTYEPGSDEERHVLEWAGIMAALHEKKSPLASIIETLTPGQLEQLKASLNASLGWSGLKTIYPEDVGKLEDLMRALAETEDKPTLLQRGADIANYLNSL
ncbi:MAG TPA: hypothetical protein VMT99_02880 [Candidatus Paceibacterota bacterium]|nr:hypothetical protein [Candidatus Paceibacterota bacterium]